MAAASHYLSDAEFDALKDVGHDVLHALPHRAGACVMMSALYVGRLRSLGHTSASLVGGALSIAGTTIFGRSTTAKPFTRTDHDWGGHAWVTFGEYIADVSLVTTAYSPHAPRMLARHITPRIKPTQRLYIATLNGSMREDALGYSSQHIFSDDQIEILYRGALTMLPEIR